jgi:hypothetical protein
LFGNQSIVAWHRPSSEVHRVARISQHLVTTLWGQPRRGLAKHRGEKSEVLRPGRATPNVFHLAQTPARSSTTLVPTCMICGTADSLGRLPVPPRPS